MPLVGPFSSGVAAGGDGAATANQDSALEVVGALTAVYVDYLDSPPATTDVVISTKGTDPNAPALTLLSLTDKNTDGWFFPRAAQHLNTDGSALTQYTVMFVDDKINVLIDDANANDYVNVWLMVE